MAGLPADLSPADRAGGYQIQALLEARSARLLYGWKIAATSLAGQKHIGVDGPLAGRILAEQVLPEGRAVSLAGNHMRLAECEFAFTMSSSLPPRAAPYQVEEVLAAVASLHPAIELPDTRFEACETVGAAMLIADNACAHQFILGSACTGDWRALDLASQQVQASLEREAPGPDGTPCKSLQQHHGVGAHVLGDPRLGLTWLANELSRHGVGLAAGAVVTTGTCVVPIPVQPETL